MFLPVSCSWLLLVSVAAVVAIRWVTSISSRSSRNSSNPLLGLLGTFQGSFGPCLGQLGPIFEQTWVYLRLFEAILGNLEAILGTSRQKEFLEGPRVSVGAIFLHVGAHFLY